MMRAAALGLILLACCAGGETEVEEAVGGQSGNDSWTRPPAVAGQFYSSSPEELAVAVNGYLSMAGADSLQGHIISAVVPHAGLQFSGPAAAEVYSAIREEPYDLIYILAPAHGYPLRGISVLNADSCATPLGSVSIDMEAAERLATAHPSAQLNREPHLSEHSIEVQLPFLQQVLPPGFSVVPLLIGSCPTEDLAFLAELIYAEGEDRNILLLASSDLSHYPPESVARELDAHTLDLYLQGDPLEFAAATARPEDSGVATLACGRLPMTAALYFNRLHLGWNSVVLAQTNSADRGGDRQRTVGYGAVVTTVDPDRAGEDIGEPAERRLCRIAREELERAAGDQPPGEYDFRSRELLLPRGAFVTYTRRGALRGCIGSIRPVQPLGEAVAGMARQAADADPRFPPIGLEELDEIELEISILTPLMLVDDTSNVEVGVDGLYLLQDGRAGVLLPQVPVQQGWNRREYIRNLAIKAGLPPDGYDPSSSLLFRFGARLISPSS